jgi:hypothetical protein
MMTTIFEQETEVGRCTYEPSFNLGETELSTVCVHSIATVNGNRGLLKIEQHCYLRHGGEIPDQPWIKPEVTLEPAMHSRAQMIQFATEQHEKFCDRVRMEFPHEYLVTG